MSSIIDAINAANKASETAPKKKAQSAEDLQNSFLKLLVTQLQNQDPTQPVDNKDSITQLAQISSLEGVTRLNETLDQVLGQVTGAKTFDLIDKDVLVDGKTLTLTAVNGGVAGVAGYQLTNDADKVVVEIRNANGALVKKLDLGPQVAGANGFAWDGSVDGGGVAPAGSYTFTANSILAGKTQAAKTLSFDHVIGVEPTANGVSLTLQGAGKKTYNDIKLVL